MFGSLKSGQLAEPTRLQIILWGAIMAVTLGLLVYDWADYRVGMYGDDSTYVALADSLVLGLPYGTVLDPQNYEPTQFPFVFPMLLAPIRAIAPNALDALRIVPLAATLGFLSVLFWGWHWLGRGLNYWYGLGVTALTAWSPVTILHGFTVMSEAVFMLFCLLWLVWVEHVIEHPTRGWGIVLGVVAVGLVYARTVGWMFFGVGIGYLIWKKRGAVLRELAATAAVMILLAGSVLSTTSVRPLDLVPQEYSAQFASVLNILAKRAAQTTVIPRPGSDADGTATASRSVKPLTDTLLTHVDIADLLPFQWERALIRATDQAGLTFLRYIPILALILVIGYGTVMWVRQTGVTAFQLVAVTYMVVLLLWIWVGARLVYPIQPQIFVALLVGLAGVWRAITHRILRWNGGWTGQAVAVMVLLILGAWVWLDLKVSPTMFVPDYLLARTAILRANLPTDAIVLSTRAPTDYLYLTQTFVEVPRSFGNPNAIRGYLRRNHIQYVVSPSGVVPPPGGSEDVRIGIGTRFRFAIEPLVQNGTLQEKYLNARADIAIYKVDERRLEGQR